MNRKGRSYRAPAIFIGTFSLIVAACFYWHPVKARLGVIATLVNGPVPLTASGGLEFTSETLQVLVVMPSTA